MTLRLLRRSWSGIFLSLGLALGGVAVLAQDTTQAEAAFSDANRFHEGIEVPQNHGRAAELYLQAAEMGHAGAQNQMGKYLFSGLARGGESKAEDAIAWLRAAAESGDAGFVFDLAKALEATGQAEEAAALYLQAAESGNTDAAVNLAVLYQHGNGVAQDFARARKLYEWPAESGHARALNNLGLLYVRGDGVTQDYAKAAELFTAAAEQGLKQAMTNLGVLYDNGFGVPQSDETAAMWYRRGGRGIEGGRVAGIYDPRLMVLPEDTQTRAALLPDLLVQAEAGDPVAQFLAGWLLMEDGNMTAAARWFTKAAEKGHVPSMVNLARLHFLGRGVLQDYVLGQMWVTLAMAGGMPEAGELAAGLGLELSPSQLFDAQTAAAARWPGIDQR
ncbi:Localization factor PodJL [Shimia sp. SK013]|uniref:tetratricopeptide repeat protein n=1 Tax=Shimia sp. SK013 TaxID=1389006 RepID=UPI0006B5C8F4|nr:SEL1-like repeat protein [Shimia sp. SK013]KPA19792.1 Localization factor PodJL [Shimia sp. SK013]